MKYVTIILFSLTQLVYGQNTGAISDKLVGTWEFAQGRSQLSKIIPGDAIEMIAPGLISTTFGEYSSSFNSSRNELYFI